MPDRWTVEYRYREMSLRMRLALTSFKHVGIFPEQAANWNFIYDRCRALAAAAAEPPRVLNLFAYTGGATLAARAAGAEVTHVDSVRQVVTWARENMELSGLDGVRWIVEDAHEVRAARGAPRQPLMPASSSILRPTGGVPTAKKVGPRGGYLRDAGVLRPSLGGVGGLSGAESLLDGTLLDAGPHGRAPGLRRSPRGAVGRAVLHGPRGGSSCRWVPITALPDKCRKRWSGW